MSDPRDPDVGGRPAPAEAGDEQEIAETLDDDKIHDLDLPENPALGVLEFGTTPLEESGGESFADRDERYVHREDLREAPPAHAGLIDPDDELRDDLTGGALGEDGTKELVAIQADEPDLLTAEEAAIHVREPLTDDDQAEPLDDLLERPEDVPSPGHGVGALGLDGAALRDDRG